MGWCDAARCGARSHPQVDYFPITACFVHLIPRHPPPPPHTHTARTFYFIYPFIATMNAAEHP